MASKRRIRKNQCDGKIKHPTEDDAWKHLRALKKRDNAFMNIYKCKFCKCWHLGHATRKE